MRKTEVDNCFTKGYSGDQKQVVLQRVTWWLFTMHFCFDLEIHPDILSGATFHTENDPEQSNEILEWKVERASNACHGLNKSYGQ